MACTDKNFRQNPQRTQPQSDLLAGMANAQFCLVMPGNVQSSGHLADAFFTGCIPVFLGPPFHTLPIPHMVSFKAYLLVPLSPMPCAIVRALVMAGLLLAVIIHRPQIT